MLAEECKPAQKRTLDVIDEEASKLRMQAVDDESRKVGKSLARAAMKKRKKNQAQQQGGETNS